MRVAAVYCITNIINNKKYIGVSIYPEGRMNAHLNGTGSKLVKKAVKKYSIDYFKKEIMLVGLETYCYMMEEKIISALNTQQPNGYNIAPGGDRPPILTAETLPHWLATMEAKRASGWIKSDTGKTKTHKGRPLTEEHKLKISIGRTGKKHSEETKQKLSEKRKGRTPHNKGKSGPKQSDETKAKRAATMQAKRASGWTNNRKHK